MLVILNLNIIETIFETHYRTKVYKSYRILIKKCKEFCSTEFQTFAKINSLLDKQKLMHFNCTSKETYTNLYERKYCSGSFRRLYQDWAKLKFDYLLGYLISSLLIKRLSRSTAWCWQFGGTIEVWRLFPRRKWIEQSTNIQKIY